MSGLPGVQLLRGTASLRRLRAAATPASTFYGPAACPRTAAGNGLRSGRKVLRQKLLGETMVGYYPEDISKKDPFMLDIKAEKCVRVGRRLAGLLGSCSGRWLYRAV